MTSQLARPGTGSRRALLAAVGAVGLVAAAAALPLSATPPKGGGRAGAGAAEPAAAGMKPYPSPYYNVYTDLDAEDVKEATLRMTRMAEEYHERTAGFSGVIRQKLPFYLFKRAEDYYAAGAPVGSAGVFMSRGDTGKLMAIAGEKSGRGTWHVVQHEGFHQFAHAVIRGELPTWVNEGLAEYFGESIFTGDGFTTGVIPPGRLRKVQEGIQEKRFKPFKEMMLLSLEEWNAGLSINNYDQAWAMTHFLAHGDDGKYQKAFGNFMNELGKNRPWQQAWENQFGSADGFEKKWAEWWLGLPDNPTKGLYGQATVATLTSFLGRANVQKQKFDTWDEFLRTAKAGELKMPADDWLPPSLLKVALATVERSGGVQWSLPMDAAKNQQVVVALPDGTKIVGSYNPKASKGKVTVAVDDMAIVIEKAKALIADNKKDQAKTLIQDAVRKNPKSPLVEDARKLLPQTK